MLLPMNVELHQNFFLFCSHYGAHQLKLDLHNLKEWIIQDKFQFSSEIISSVLSLDVFNVMDNAVGLLCCQPQRRRGREISEPGESGLSATSTSSAGRLIVWLLISPY